jgi:hypothetical protein
MEAVNPTFVLIRLLCWMAPDTKVFVMGEFPLVRKEGYETGGA